jgi:hypothetical protein
MNSHPTSDVHNSYTTATRYIDETTETDIITSGTRSPLNDVYKYTKTNNTGAAVVVPQGAISICGGMQAEVDSHHEKKE